MVTVQKNEFKFELNKDVIDSLTGFCGVITARAEYLHESNSYCVENRNEVRWISEMRLVLNKPESEG